MSVLVTISEDSYTKCITIKDSDVQISECTIRHSKHRVVAHIGADNNHFTIGIKAEFIILTGCEILSAELNSDRSIFTRDGNENYIQKTTYYTAVNGYDVTCIYTQPNREFNGFNGRYLKWYEFQRIDSMPVLK